MNLARTSSRTAAQGAPPETAAAGAARRCIVTGEVLPKARMIRFVAGPDGSVVPDLTATLPGRGLWLSARRDVIHTACARNLFAKAAKAPLRPDPDLAARVERLLARRCVELLGLARRAGTAVGGYEKASAKLSSGAAGALLQARDAAKDGRRKMRSMARAGDADLPVVDCLDAAELGRALGQDRYVHVALDRGPLTRRILDQAARLAGLRGTPAKASEHS